MYEREWLTSDDPREMMLYLNYGGGDPFRENKGPKSANYPGSRKLRLFAVACVRQLWHLLQEQSREAVAFAEQFADFDHSRNDLQRSQTSSFNHAETLEDMLEEGVNEEAIAAYAASNCCQGHGWYGAYCVASNLNLSETCPQAMQADILRDIVGNPFKPVITPKQGNDPVSGYYVCEHCNHKWSARKYRNKERRCPSCRSEFQRKMRRREVEPVIDPAALTKTVISLAQAAYNRNWREECTECNGEPVCALCNGTSTVEHHSGNGVINCPQGYDDDGHWIGCKTCNRCNNGYLESGLLDPNTMLILADALEESNLPPEIDCPCVRPWDGTLADLDMTRRGLFGIAVEKRCALCNEIGRIIHPVLSHLRSGKRHYRGCWVIDLILGPLAGET